MKIQINARNRSHQFDAGENDKILYAGLSGSVGLSYECGSGTCGTCKARLISGDIVDEWPEAPGKKYIKGSDEFLMCQCRARSDLVVQVDNFVQEMEPGECVPAPTKGHISSAVLLTGDVMHLRIALDQPMDFDAGQFVLVQVPGIAGFRGWSMVNYERHATTLEFVVKKKPGGGVSEWLFSHPPTGVAVDVFGPLGHATFYPTLDKDLLCIAGGSGIAGMMSILSRASQDGYFTRHQGDVFFGVRTMKDAFFLHEFSRYTDLGNGRLKVTIALSDEAVPAWAAAEYPLLGFDKGFVHEVAGRHMQGRYGNVRAYLAGPPPAVEASIRMLLLQARLTADNIRYDKFS
jgi:toluene monooxygenase electron transfer component